jgi:hypothetical protein
MAGTGCHNCNGSGIVEDYDGDRVCLGCYPNEPPLTATGTQILLVYGARIFPPRSGRPGINVIVHEGGDVLLEPSGFGSQHAAAQAIHRASDVCHEAGLDVLAGPRPRTRIVRKRS